ncbi:FAD-binding protein [Pleionea sediminis]|uniref:FAD-binding protein n=1 Tax=Pleionea sediminis TaxID=2569479 RepID=UPI001184B419|nr:FAD-binding protein [Pleionea sediminis]
MNTVNKSIERQDHQVEIIGIVERQDHQELANTNYENVNDVHSKLNATAVRKVIKIKSTEDIVRTVQLANKHQRIIAVAGGRHAMGGQQFANDEWLLDMTEYNQVIEFDHSSGQIKVQAGIQWPELIRRYHVLQHNDGIKWGIAQKQTGADRLTIGGAIAANIHGRGLAMKPFIQDVVELTLVNANGNLVRCSRDENYALFKRVIGGYGLFGVVAEVTIQLQQRQKVKRIVEALNLNQLPDFINQRIREGALYGDFQFAIDPESDDFLTVGICSCYLPVRNETPIPKKQLRLSKKRWMQLLGLAHHQKTKAFEQFKEFYLKSNNQLYWSDTHQLSIYLDDYHTALDKQMDSCCPGSEMITELYVPKDQLISFMENCKEKLRELSADIVYGTVRFIKQDDESSLAWAKEDFACIIFNVHTDHNAEGIEKSKVVLKTLIDNAIEHQGNYFLTYHRFADKNQVTKCYPQMPNFLADKLRWDPKERFQSDWYNHYKTMFASEILKVSKGAEYD